MYAKQTVLAARCLAISAVFLLAATAQAQECINPVTGEPDVPVLCFANPCDVSTCEGDPDASCEADYCGGCHAIYSDADGNPALCDPTPVVCTEDVKVCPDGSFVSRDPANGCAFFPCPEVCINPVTGEPDVPVACFADPCEVETCEADPDAACAPNFCGGCHAIFTDADGNPAQCGPIVCTRDVMACPDGSFVSRDPSNGCEFFPCPAVCTDDAMLCPDGSFVSRDPANRCEFSPCPEVCTDDVMECPDGSFDSRDPSNGCAFFPCPEVCINPITGEPDVPVACFADPCEVETCEADPDAACAPNFCGGCHAIFTDADGNPAECDPSPVFCTDDVQVCPDGSVVSRDPANGCEFFPCPAVCTDDAMLCPDGSVVGRDPANGCQFFPCPAACTDDVMECPDGSFVSRDPANGCAFFPCPEVCINPVTGEPDVPVACFADPCEVETCEADPDAACAPNFCGGCHAIFSDADGNPADCDPSPVFCTDDVQVCPDGSVVSRDSANGCEFSPCPAVCTDDAMLCPDGSVVSRDPANGCEFFPCPEVCINPITGEPGVPVFCLVDPCEVGTCEADPDAACSPNFCGGCHAIYTDADGNPAQCDPGPVFCTDDVQVCLDGSVVSRDPANGCEFFPCPELCEGDDATGDSDADGVCDDLDLCEGDDSTGDSDGDGVCDDRDLCADTPADAVLDATGCSGRQRVAERCGEPGDYRRGHHYLRCVVKESRAARQEGLITWFEQFVLIRQAARDLIRSRFSRWPSHHSWDRGRHTQLEPSTSRALDDSFRSSGQLS